MWRKDGRSVDVGHVGAGEWVVRDAHVRKFAELTGDVSGVHLDDAVAATSRFGRRIAHGLISASLFPSIVAACSPGAIYVSQVLQFRAPVYIDDLVRARIEVTNVRRMPSKKEGGSLVTCSTRCWVPERDTPSGSANAKADVTVIEGTATLWLPDTLERPTPVSAE